MTLLNIRIYKADYIAWMGKEEYFNKAFVTI